MLLLGEPVRQLVHQPGDQVYGQENGVGDRDHGPEHPRVIVSLGKPVLVELVVNDQAGANEREKIDDCDAKNGDHDFTPRFGQ